MESKKDIGKFFRENLDQLDLEPSAMVWDGIEKDLKEKKKRRPFFIWFFIVAFVGGAICTFTALHFDLVPNFNSAKEKNSIPSETNANSNNKTTTDYKGNNQMGSKDITETSDNPTSNETESLTNPNSKNIKSSSDTKTKVTSEKRPVGSDKNSILKKTINKKQNIAFNSKKGKLQKNLSSEKTPADAANLLGSIENSSENNSEKKVLDIKKTSLQSITQLETNKTIIDSVPKRAIETTKKEKSLTEKKKDTTVEQPQEETKFGIIIAPYYGYVYSGRIGNGTTLSDRYNVNDRGGKLSQNFGVLVRWMGTEKIGIQTGIGMVQTHRFTKVENNSSLFVSSHNLSTDSPMQSYAPQFLNDDKITFHEEISYIEVPLEAYYIWSDNKFGLATSFGISIYLLNKNEVYLESDTVSKFKIGSLNTTVEQSISANAKLNLFYKLTKKLQLDVYPEIQFQFMSHKDVSNFYPYYFSLKAGVSYKL